MPNSSRHKPVESYEQRQGRYMRQIARHLVRPGAVYSQPIGYCMGIIRHMIFCGYLRPVDRADHRHRGDGLAREFFELTPRGRTVLGP